ncbi:alanine and proline-rich secreted protein Apa, partial [Mycolicibacter algericus]|uniref:alanine and proline-rich secreted protein Apa n=1 Tax=Mycolicibacter algericus TaxID=1288388 RepID=UPI003C782AC9
MKQVDLTSTAHRGIRAVAATTWATAIAGALAFAMASPAYADPPPPPPPAPPATADAPPADAPPPADANPPAPVAEPGAPEAGRVDDVAGGFSYVLPGGWVQSDTSHLEYGSSLLSKQTGEPMLPGQPAPVANDTRIVLGKLDQRLYASAETDNAKAATRLGSDMGEFFMPYPGTRANQESAQLAGGGLTGSASYYEVKFTDPAKPVGQIWSGVIGVPPADGGTGAQTERWFVVWLGTANNPVDREAAKALTESIRPLAAAPAPVEPAPAPAPGIPGIP